MGRHYSTRDFFRQMPNALLARYFQARGALPEFDFASLKEAQPEPLIAAWNALPDNQRSPMAVEFREISEMSDAKGFRAIIDEAEFHIGAGTDELQQFVHALAVLSNHFERAMVTFLDHHRYWKGATLFHHADQLPYWRKRKNLPHRAAAVDPPSIRELADSLRNFFHYVEGRGHNCHIEPLRRGDKDYYFAYPEDYSLNSIEWVGDTFDRRPHNPAFEVIYVYSQKDGTLDLNYGGSYKTIEPLQQMFAKAILKLDELPGDPKDSRVYDLDALRRRGFRFVFDPLSGIKNVTVRKLRFSSTVKQGDRLTVEGASSDAIYDQLDRIGRSVPLHLFNVTLLELAATVESDATKPTKILPIRITHPNSCSLKYDEIDLKLRDMLHASGIEPVEHTGTPELHTLLARVGAGLGTAAFSASELARWPVATVTVMKRLRILTPATPAAEVVCPGCERQCLMPVHSVRLAGGPASAFVVCDKRTDINRVNVDPEDLEHWESTGEGIAAALATLLKLKRLPGCLEEPNRWEVGTLRGQRSAHVVLLADGSLKLELAGHSVTLAEVLELEGSQIVIDKEALIAHVESPIGGAGGAASAEQREARLAKRVAEERKKGTRAPNKAVAQEEDITPSRLKQILKRHRERQSPSDQ